MYFEKLIYFNCRIITLQYSIVVVLPCIDTNQPCVPPFWTPSHLPSHTSSIFKIFSVVIFNMVKVIVIIPTQTKNPLGDLSSFWTQWNWRQECLRAISLQLCLIGSIFFLSPKFHALNDYYWGNSGRKRWFWNRSFSLHHCTLTLFLNISSWFFLSFLTDGHVSSLAILMVIFFFFFPCSTTMTFSSMLKTSRDSE